MTLHRAVPRVLVGLAAVLPVAGCSSGGSDKPAAGATSSPPAAAPTGSESAAPTPTPTADLPTGCDSLLPFTDLDQALGRPLFGETVYVKGVAQPSINRTGRVTCQYGLVKGRKGPAPVEVGVSTYSDAESATKRVSATIAAARSGGATSQVPVTISGLPGTVLGDRTGFTALVAQGNRTVAVTVLRAVRGHPDQAAVAAAEKVLANWAE